MSRIALLVLNALLAVGAIGGAIWAVPAIPLEWMKAGPFDDFTIPALALGFVGIVAAAAFVAVLVRPWLGALASILAGSVLLVFLLVEIAVVGWTPADPALNDQFQAWLQPIFIGVGVALIGFGIGLWLSSRDEAPAMPLIHPHPA